MNRKVNYDQLNRLANAVNPIPTNPTETYTYDPVGNRTNSNQNGLSNFNIGNQLTDDADFTYVYDNNGNLTQKTNKSTSAFTLYQYDAENKLIRVVREDSSIVNYKYDGLGRRIEKEVDSVVTQYIYDNEDILLELDGSANIVARYTHGPGIDEPLIMEKCGQSFFYHANGLGSITELTDSVGSVVQSYLYSSFGKVESELDPSFAQPYTFTSREFDAETGLYFYRARYYESFVGRFLQEDPLFAGKPIRRTNPASRHLYVYVNNSPATLFDPLGLQAGGRGDCSYYDDRCKQGECEGNPDPYACQAGQCCRDFSEGLIDRCTRKCLISNDADCAKLSPTRRAACRGGYHVVCYIECFKVPVNIPRSCSGIAGGFGL